MRLALHAAAVIVLTLVTQVGGLAWLVGLGFRQRWLAFLSAYAAFWIAAAFAAPLFGRVPLPCSGEPLRVQSAFYCVTLRHYVSPEMAQVAEDAAAAMAKAYPGTVTLALDGSHPFFDGVPLLPHLSHDDGEKLDLAFFYADADGTYAQGVTRSPLGYFAFERAGDEACPPVRLTLRWNLDWLQPWLPDRPLEPQRTAALVRNLLADPRVGKVFVEPPLAASLGLSDPKLRFQGCRAARHDDHVHLQL